MIKGILYFNKSKREAKDFFNRLKKVENEYKTMNRLLAETQNKLSNSDLNCHIFNVVRVGRLYESNTDLVFTKDEKGHLVLILKYVTTSVKYQIIEIKEIKLKDGDANMITIEYNPEMNAKTEKFRTSEASLIIKVFQEFQKKAIEQSDSKKLEVEQSEKIENMGNNINEFLSFP